MWAFPALVRSLVIPAHSTCSGPAPAGISNERPRRVGLYCKAPRAHFVPPRRSCNGAAQARLRPMGSLSLTHKNVNHFDKDSFTPRASSQSICSVKTGPGSTSSTLISFPSKSGLQGISAFKIQ